MDEDYVGKCKPGLVVGSLIVVSACLFGVFLVWLLFVSVQMPMQTQGENRE